MIRKALVAAVAAAALFARAEVRTPDNDARGITITNVVCRTNGYLVAFKADVPPPYRVSIHRPDELRLLRSNPVEFVDTDGNEAFLQGDFGATELFVQVYKKNETVTPSRFTRKMRECEWKLFAMRQARENKHTILDQTIECSTIGSTPHSQAVLVKRGWISHDPDIITWTVSPNWLVPPLMTEHAGELPYTAYEKKSGE